MIIVFVLSKIGQNLKVVKLASINKYYFGKTILNSNFSNYLDWRLDMLGMLFKGSLSFIFLFLL